MPTAGPRATTAARAVAPRRYAAGLAIAAGVLVAAGCGQPQPSDEGVAPTVSVPIQPTVLPATTEPDATDPSAPVPDDDGLFDASDSLVASTCSPDAKGVWSFTGKVRNSDSVDHTFTVAVFLVTPTDVDPVASKEVAVSVPAGQTVPVEARAFATRDPKDVECLTGVTVKEG